MVVRNVSRVQINADPHRVWQVLTEPEYVAQWQYGSKLKTDWSVGGTIRFIAEWQGQVFEQWGKVEEFQPTQRLRYSLFAPRPDLRDIPENYFTMIYDLEANAEGTELCITQVDPRPGAKQEEEQGQEHPVLAQLKTLCES